MLMRTDPFREFDRLAQQVFGATRPAAMPMDAYRSGDDFVVHFDLPGIDPETIDLDVERNVLNVRAERRSPPPRARSPSSPNAPPAPSPASSSSATPSTRNASTPRTRPAS